MRTGRSTSAAERLFGGAIAVIALHVVVAGAGPLSSLAAVVGGPVLFALFLTGGRATRTALAALVGLPAMAAGLGPHLPHAVLAGATATDLTGIAAGFAGMALVGLAFHAALHGRRRRVKLLAIPVALVLAQWFVVPVMNGGIATSAPRPGIPPASALHLPGAREVEFPARDGVALAGWYVPGRNGSAVVLMHGSHGDRTDTIGHLRMLRRAGYGVLAFDARGHGDSAGQTNALGWRGTDDVSGAVAFLRRQRGVDPRRIAALGLSMGAEEALRAAGDGVALAAVVADGAGASTTGDSQLVANAPIPRSVEWMAIRAVEAFSGDPEPPPLADTVPGIRVPVLLIASTARDELALDRAYARRIGAAAAEVWHVGDAGHTRALDRHPALYAARVRGFLDAALRR